MFQQGMFSIDPGATPDQLERKRQAIRSLVNKQPARYAGAGFADLASGILGAVKNRKMDKFENEKMGQAQEAFNTALGGMGQPFSPTARPPEPVQTTNLDGQGVANDTMETLIRTGLQQRGMPAHVADAFILNFRDESNLDPNINEQNPLVAGSRGGFGLAQWTGPRRRELEQFAASQGKPAGDVDVQLDFLMQELQGSERNAAQSIMSAPDSGAAAQEIVNRFLRPSEEHRARRAAQYGGVANGVNNIMGITEAMSNPWIMQDPGKAAILNSMLGRQMTPPTPQYQQMSGSQLGMTGEAAGNMFNVAPDGKISQIGGGGVTVHNNAATQPQMGKIPQGYTVVEDPSNPAGYRMQAIPGGPEDSTQADAATQSARDTASDNVVTAASRARQSASQRNGPTALTSVVGAVNPYSDSAEVMRQVNVLKDITSAEQLNAMRRQSKTGGALGNVTERELGLLSRQGGALDPNSPNFERDLADYERAILRTIHGKEAGDAIYQQSRQSDGWTEHNGVKIRVKQ